MQGLSYCRPFVVLLMKTSVNQVDIMGVHSAPWLLLGAKPSTQLVYIPSWYSPRIPPVLRSNVQTTVWRLLYPVPILAPAKLSTQHKSFRAHLRRPLSARTLTKATNQSSRHSCYHCRTSSRRRRIRPRAT
jgi:hypothetical protein